MRTVVGIAAFLGAGAGVAGAVAAAPGEGVVSREVLVALLILALLVIAPLAVATMLRERRLREVEELRARLDRRERVLEMVVDTVSSGIVALDAEGRVELANEAARRMLGLPRDAAPDRWPEAARFRPPDGADEVGVAPVWAMMTGKRVRGADYVLEVEGREPVRVRVNAEPAPLGAPIGAVMTLEDVTEQHRARVLGDRAERLDALGKLTGGVAHDFNNLLSTIMGALQLAERRSQGDPRIARHLDAALRATRTGADLVDRLLGFAKRGAAALEDVALDALFAEAASLAQNAVNPSVRLVFEAPPAGWAVRCDRAQIVTAILNLVANARDAIVSDRGAGRIAVSARESVERRDCVEIVVADDGPGMSAEVRARALDPFFTTKGAARGTGLGLSMVYGALRRCGGDLRIESEPGKGAVIRMLTPKARAAAAPEPAPQARAARDGAGRAVLLVEDEPDLLDTAEAMLVELGYAVIRATDGPSALKELALGRVVDVLVTDVMMPGGMSGVDLAERARAMRPGLPVVLASGYAEGAAEGGLRLGAALVRKPYSMDDLGAALRGAVGKGGRTARTA
jgi:signal transduction histidine kinase/ActR/RegA family two-component response regulator